MPVNGAAQLHAARRELREELRLETYAAGDVVYRVHDAGSPFATCCGVSVPPATREPASNS